MGTQKNRILDQMRNPLPILEGVKPGAFPSYQGPLAQTRAKSDASDTPAAPLNSSPAPVLSLDEVKALVLERIDQKKILGTEVQQIKWVIQHKFLVYTGKFTHRMWLDDSMYYVLERLTRTNTITLYQVMSYSDGLHGVPQGAANSAADAICYAMDIFVYAGFRFNLINGVGAQGGTVQSTIDGLVALIDNLPPGVYSEVGMPRPSPESGGIAMPDKDVFLPVLYNQNKEPAVKAYLLSDNSFATLGAKQVPEDVLSKIAPLKDRVFTQKLLVKELTQVLDKEEANKYQQLIMQSTVNGGEWPMYKPGEPRNNPTPQFVNKAAAKVVNDALVRRGADVEMVKMFMDAPDHLHLAVKSARYQA